MPSSAWVWLSGLDGLAVENASLDTVASCSKKDIMFSCILYKYLYMKSYKGRYYPLNPKKYKGNPSQVIYRSLWERKLMVYCDKNEKVLESGVVKK